MVTDRSSNARRFWPRIAIGVGLYLAFIYLAGCHRTPGPSERLLTAINTSDISAIKAYIRGEGDPNIALEYVPTCHATPLHLATRNGSVEIVRLFLDAGANPNAIRSCGETPLYWAIDASQTPGVVECVKLLLDRGADPSARVGGESILHSACYVSDPGSLEIAKLLIERGADVNAIDQNGDTPLHTLASRPSGAQRQAGNLGREIAKKLLDHGANPHVKNWKGQTPLDLAREARYAGIAAQLVAAEAGKGPITDYGKPRNGN